MIPDGWDIKLANNELQKIKRSAIEHFKGKPHSTIDVDNYIAEKWHKLCGLTFEKVEPPTPQVPPPPSLVEVTGPVVSSGGSRARKLGDM